MTLGALTSALFLLLVAFAACFLAGDNRQAGLYPAVHAALEIINALETAAAQRLDRLCRRYAIIANRDYRLCFELLELGDSTVQLFSRNILRINDVAPRKRIGAANIDNNAIIVDEFDGLCGFHVDESAGLAAQLGKHEDKKADHQRRDEQHVVARKF